MAQATRKRAIKQRRTKKGEKQGKNAWTLRARLDFLEHMKATGNVTGAAAAVGKARSGAYALRARDKEFADAWDDAHGQFVDMVEGEAVQRAVHGTQRAVTYQGKVTDHVMDKSDRLLEFILKGHRPERYSDKMRLAGHDGREIIIKVVE